jgi:4-amino-4-deoxy-L-arabinose transferase-like glycosyltransferase
MSPNIFRSEILFYGPVYFFIQSFIIKHFGLDIVQFRMLNFLAGILLVLVFRVIMLYLTKNKGMANLLALLLLIDPIFVQNIHSGRMDMFATLAAIVGIWAYFRFSATKNSFFLYLLATLFSIGYLTTPRVLFIIIPLCSFLAQLT